MASDLCDGIHDVSNPDRRASQGISQPTLRIDGFLVSKGLTHAKKEFAFHRSPRFLQTLEQKRVLNRGCVRAQSQDVLERPSGAEKRSSQTVSCSGLLNEELCSTVFCMLSPCVAERSKALTTIESSVAGMVEELAVATDKGDVDCQGCGCWDKATISSNDCFEFC